MGSRSLYTARSKFHTLRVVDEGSRRLLYFARNPQTQMQRDTPGGGGLEYTTCVHCIRALTASLRNVLFIGLGGGGLPKEFLEDYPETQVDVVEIDPVVVEVARTYFALPRSPRLRVVVADGREFVRRTRRRYDFLLVDAYCNDRRGRLLIPPHLTTVEFIREAAARLTDTGWLSYNVTGVAKEPGGPMVRAVLETLAVEFPYRCLVETRQDENVVLFGNRATKVPSRPEFRCRVQRLLTTGVLKRPRTQKYVSRYRPDDLVPRGVVLTDPGDEVFELMGCRKE